MNTVLCAIEHICKLWGAMTVPWPRADPSSPIGLCHNKHLLLEGFLEPPPPPPGTIFRSPINIP